MTSTPVACQETNEYLLNAQCDFFSRTATFKSCSATFFWPREKCTIMFLLRFRSVIPVNAITCQVKQVVLAFETNKHLSKKI